MKKTRSSKRIFYFDEGGYFIESGGFVFNNDKTTLYCLDDGTLGTYTIPSSVTKIHDSLFDERQKTYDSNFKIDVAIVEEGVTKIPYECFAYCDLKEIYLPSTITSFGNRCFYWSNGDVKVFLKNPTPVSIFGSSCANYTSNTRLICPYNSYSAYLSSSWKNYFTIEYDIEIQGCNQLSITADDVSGNYGFTTIHYNATCDVFDNVINEQLENVVISGDAVSEEFGYNNTENDIVRNITYTCFGISASTTITQGVFGQGDHSVVLKATGDYSWGVSTTKNPDSAIYDCYSAYGGNYSYSTMDITFGGYSSFKLFLKKGYKTDKIFISELNDLENLNEVEVSIGSETAIDGCTLYELTNLKGGIYKIRIRGYHYYNGSGSQCVVIIPKDQEE